MSWADEGAVVALDGVSADAAPVDLAVYAGAVLLGVARASVPRILYDGVLRLRLRPDDDDEQAQQDPARRCRAAGVVEVRCRVAGRVRLDNVVVRLASTKEFHKRGAWSLRAQWRALEDGASYTYAWRSPATKLRGQSSLVSTLRLLFLP